MTTTTKSIYQMTEYEIDDRDTEMLLDGMRSAIDWMRKNGTLPERTVSKAKPVPANDNELAH